MGKIKKKKFSWDDGSIGRFQPLSTFHINKVMARYEKNQNFKFLGAIPIDFNDFEEFGIRNLDYGKLLTIDKFKLGFVFNFDKNYQPGSHWVALYSDLTNGEIYFFDSHGLKPKSRILMLMRKISNFCKIELGNKKINMNYNKIKHQSANIECGIYSIHFLVRMLEGESFNDISRNRISDRNINKYRNVYFNVK